MQQGASVDKHNENGLTSLRVAASKEEFQTVPSTSNYVPSVDITDEDGSTPPYVAGHLKVLREMLKYGCTVQIMIVGHLSI